MKDEETTEKTSDQHEELDQEELPSIDELIKQGWENINLLRKKLAYPDLEAKEIASLSGVLAILMGVLQRLYADKSKMGKVSREDYAKLAKKLSREAKRVERFFNKVRKFADISIRKRSF